MLMAALFLLVSALTFVPIVAGADTLAPGALLRTNQTLTSASATFALGFFHSGHSNFYLAIWYNQIPGPVVVWVANRNSSLTDPTGGAAISPDDGNLVVLDGDSTVIWSSGVAIGAGGRTTSAVIEDNGNLALKGGADGKVLWHSYDYPTDTMLPGMSLRMNLTTLKVTGFVSWRSSDDPSPGNYYFGPDPLWPIQSIIASRDGGGGARGWGKRWRSTMWSSKLTSDVTTVNGATSFAMYLTVLTVGGEMVWTQSISDASLVWRYRLNSSGFMELLVWLPEARSWDVPWFRPKAGTCRRYAPCGPNGVCIMNQRPECGCLDGFRPVREAEWKSGNWSAGCERADGGEGCRRGDVFLRLGPVKLPDFPISMLNLSALHDCADQCLRNCSCSAYSFANVSLDPSPRCLHWTGRLLDIEGNFTGSGQDLYVRLSKDQLDRSSTISNKRKHLVTIVVTTLCGGTLVSALLAYLLWRRLKNEGKGINMMVFDSRLVSEDLPFFNFSSLQVATENFSPFNKLGEGGFGSVYRGKLANGQEIAVKRLAQSSGQGLEEFKTEVELIAKLQHRNLVRLLGWCDHKEEKLLIYEFMPNRSLDKLLFDPASQVKLDWGKRFLIAEGIAQGLLYIHKHSRFKIVHRDLKPSNILLDVDMNPKISDFGLARIVAGNQTGVNTKRIVGTYGYMSPEYALHGIFSEKSDVYSFGVILLELVSGKRATGVYPLEHSDHLLGYAWTLWAEDRHLDIIDPCLSMTEEVARCIHIALLCVQEGPAERPSISSVVFLLSSQNSNMPFPKEPAFCGMKSVVTTDTSPLVCASMAAQDPFLISSAYYDGR